MTGHSILNAIPHSSATLCPLAAVQGASTVVQAQTAATQVHVRWVTLVGLATVQPSWMQVLLSSFVGQSSNRGKLSLWRVTHVRLALPAAISASSLVHLAFVLSRVSRPRIFVHVRMPAGLSSSTRGHYTAVPAAGVWDGRGNAQCTGSRRCKRASYRFIVCTTAARSGASRLYSMLPALVRSTHSWS